MMYFGISHAYLMQYHALLSGARLGLLQTKLGLIKILSKYELSPSKRTLIPMVLNPKAPTTSPLGDGMYLNIRKIY